MQMLLVFSLMQPPWDGQMATRFLVSAEASDLSVTVLLNKADLVTEETREQIKEEVRALSPPFPDPNLHPIPNCLHYSFPSSRTAGVWWIMAIFGGSETQ